MEEQEEQIALEIIPALITQATANSLSVSDYLARLLGLTNGHAEENVALSVMSFELAGALIGAFDSSVPEPDSPAHLR